MRPSETRRPTTPLHKAGMRTEPPMSLPCAIGPIPDSVGSRGFRVRPCSGLSLNTRSDQVGALLRPMITAPARFRLATTGLSSVTIVSR